MTFSLNIPTSQHGPLLLHLPLGQSLFLVGANGVGKSSLMHHLYAPHHGQAVRLSAHRQTWFSSNSLAFSPEQRRQTESTVKGYDTNAQSRWRDDYSAQRANIALYDLIDAENVRARSIAEAVDLGDMNAARERAKQVAPLKRINELLRLSNIPIEISVQANEQVLASRLGGPTYSVAELSDGERNALIIAATVLTAPAATLILIDEPERHIHRSITAPLLRLLFAQREDCAFIVSTHDVTLPLEIAGSRTLLLRGCNYQGSTAVSWEADLLEPGADIDDSLKRDILGARRRVIFVEGTSESLDFPMYALVLPNTTVIPKRTCRDVIHAVAGIRGSNQLHWVHACGLIDHDRRTEDELTKLASTGVFALPVYSIESVYFHPSLQRRLAGRQADLSGRSAEHNLEDAKQAALRAVEVCKQHMCNRVVERSVRQELEDRLPTSKDIVNGGIIRIEIDIQERLRVEAAALTELLNAADLQKILERYPLRETPALTEIARRLGFQDRRHYEDSVRKLLMDDAAALSEVRSWFGALASQFVEFSA